MVRDIGSDGPRPSAGASPPLCMSRTVHAWGSNDPCLGLGRSAMAQTVFFAAADLDLAFREGPRRGGEILGCVLASSGHPKRL
jgi:hypothetical protein